MTRRILLITLLMLSISGCYRKAQGMEIAIAETTVTVELLNPDASTYQAKIYRFVDYEHDNVCYVVNYRLSCLPLKK